LRRMTFAEAMDKYGVDKPDLRLDLTLCDVTAPLATSGFKIFEAVIAAGGIVKGLRIPRNDKLTRALIDGLPELGKSFGLKGVTTVRLQDGGVWQGLKGVSDEARTRVNQIAGAEIGDALILVADKSKVANTALGHIR